MNCTDAERKAWATLQAKAILAGMTASLVEGDNGRPLLVVSRWAFTRSFADLASAENWLTQVNPAAVGAPVN